MFTSLAADCRDAVVLGHVLVFVAARLREQVRIVASVTPNKGIAFVH